MPRFVTRSSRVCRRLITNLNRDVIRKMARGDLQSSDLSCDPRVINLVRDHEHAIETIANQALPLINLHPEIWQALALGERPKGSAPQLPGDQTQTLIRELISITQHIEARDSVLAQLITGLNPELLSELSLVSPTEEQWLGAAHLTLTCGQNYRWWCRILEFTSPESRGDLSEIESLYCSTTQFAGMTAIPAV